MSLLDQIERDYIEAFKNRQTERVDVLRLLKSAIKNEAIKVGGLGTVLTDQQILSVLNREVKQRRDSIAQYEAAGRDELAQKEKNELAIIETYMPKSLGEAELEQLISEILAETGATSKADMGKVMGALKAKLDNPADLSRAAAMVHQKLQ